MKKLCVLTVSCLLLGIASHALGADAASFDPTKVAIKTSASGGVPVGTVIAWPVAGNPADAANWLECKGQAITQAAYPELYALIGGKLPDYRGLFLRGLGGKSAALGVLQEQAVGPHSHKIPAPWPNPGKDGMSHDTSREGDVGVQRSGEWGEYTQPGENMAEETRPANKAVRYLIRAKP
jgi:hypothetical protein